MGIQRRKFTVGFKQQVVHEIESGLMSLSEASRKYEVSASVINRWRTKFRAGDLVEGKSSREKLLESENRALKEKVGELYMQVEHLKSWTSTHDGRKAPIPP